MPQFYRVLQASPLGDPYTPDRPGAKALQSFWCQVDGVESPVMISKQVPNTPSLVEGHYGVLELKHGAKSDYYKFTSMQVPQGTQRPRYTEQAATPAATAASAPTVHVDTGVLPEWFIPYAGAIKEIVTYVRDQRSAKLGVAPEQMTIDEGIENAAEDELPVTEMTDSEYNELFQKPDQISGDK